MQVLWAPNQITFLQTGYCKVIHQQPAIITPSTKIMSETKFSIVIKSHSLDWIIHFFQGKVFSDLNFNPVSVIKRNCHIDSSC